MAVSSSGALLALPEPTLLSLQAPIRLQPGVNIPKIKNAFYRLSEGTWEYIGLCKALCRGNRKVVTRQQVNTIWYKFVMGAWEQWLKVERSRLLYHIPAGVGLLQSWREGWEVVKGAMRSMASSTADEFWLNRQIQLNLNNSEFDITPPIIASPSSSAEFIKSLETFTRLAFYTKIAELSDLYAGDADAQLRNIPLSNTLLSMEHFDAFTLGLPNATPSNTATKKYQNKTARKNGFKKKAGQRVDDELGGLLGSFSVSEPPVNTNGDDALDRDCKKDILKGVALGNRFVTEQKTSDQKQMAPMGVAMNGGMILSLPIRARVKRKAEEDKENAPVQGTMMGAPMMELTTRTKKQRIMKEQ